MFSDGHNFANPDLAPNSSSDLKVIKITPNLVVNGTGALQQLMYCKILSRNMESDLTVLMEC